MFKLISASFIITSYKTKFVFVGVENENIWIFFVVHGRKIDIKVTKTHLEISIIIHNYFKLKVYLKRYHKKQYSIPNKYIFNVKWRFPLSKFK